MPLLTATFLAGALAVDVWLLDRFGAKTLELLWEKLGEDGLLRLEVSELFRQWDDRLGPDRLWLMRFHPDWLRGQQHALVPLDFAFGGPTADTAEAAFHANRILNFLEDVWAVVVAKPQIFPLLRPLTPSLALWFQRLRPAHLHLQQESPPRGWSDAERLFNQIVNEEHYPGHVPVVAAGEEPDL